MPIAVGSKAPDFSLKSKNASGLVDVKLSNNFGKKNTLILFFPAAFTGVCTQEMCGLSSGLNAYAGGTTVSNGTLVVSNTVGSGCGTGSVAVRGGSLRLDHPSSLNPGTILTLNSAPAAGSVNLNFSGTQTVSALFFGGAQKAAGTWAASGAAHNSTAFAGTGVLNVIGAP